MNTDEIQCILVRALCGSKCRFLGVFPADRVPVDAINNKGLVCCVANTDPHNRPGEHWVALVLGDGCCEYFDPYGMPLSAYPALDKRLGHVLPTLQAASAVQPPLSSTCGHFCIYYLCCRPYYKLPRIVDRLLLIPERFRDKFVYDYVYDLTAALRIERPCRDACKGSQCCKPRMKQ